MSNTPIRVTLFGRVGPEGFPFLADDVELGYTISADEKEMPVNLVGLLRKLADVIEADPEAKGDASQNLVVYP